MRASRKKGIHLIRYYSKQKRRTKSKMKKFAVILVVIFSFIFLEATTAAVVVYKKFSSRICGGSMWWIYLKSRDWKLLEAARTGSWRTGSDLISRDIEGIPSVRACATRSWGFPPFFVCFWICCEVGVPALCSYYSSTVEYSSTSTMATGGDRRLFFSFFFQFFLIKYSICFIWFSFSFIFFIFFYFFLFFFIRLIISDFFFFLIHFQQVTTQNSVQCLSLPWDFLRAWRLINCSFLLCFSWTTFLDSIL